METQEENELTSNAEGGVDIEALKAKHTILDERVREIEAEHILSQEQEMEIKRLKKEKLALKTQLAALGVS
ncbi:MAG: YdcH family protein [bacterium]|nr:YdcH family protein [bacterium]